jgi:hypothetical protein
MKNPADMTDTQLAKWLDKTSTTLYNAVYAQNIQRKQDVGDRYAELIEEAKRRGYWQTYIDERGLADHDQYDIC